MVIVQDVFHKKNVLLLQIYRSFANKDSFWM